MRYKGRIFGVLFVAAILLFVRETVKSYFGEVPHPFPLPAIVLLIIAWFLGKQYDKYVYVSMIDPLTGLYNRRYVINRFSKLVSYTKRRKLNLSVILVDVNDFKEINDNLGHDIGDKVLEDLSKILLEAFRKKDIVARWGGDEFLILTVFSDERETVNKISDFKSKLSKENNHHLGRLSVSIGKSAYPSDATSLKELAIIADTNMYESKFNYRIMKST